jgi:hypothetical protein
VAKKTWGEVKISQRREVFQKIVYWNVVQLLRFCLRLPGRSMPARR